MLAKQSSFNPFVNIIMGGGRAIFILVQSRLAWDYVFPNLAYKYADESYL